MDIRTLLDIQQITEVLYRYARGVDRRDSELIRMCFHPDAYDEHGSLSGNVDQLIVAIEDFSARWDLTYHFIGNVLIDVHDDVARSEAYAIATHRREPGPGRDGKDDTWGIRYVDRFERRNDLWKIAYRVITQEWRTVVSLPQREGGSPLPGRWGSHGEQDPLSWILEQPLPTPKR